MENKKIFVYVFVSLLALYLIKIFNISYPINITTTSKSSEMAVVGEGKVEAIPDTAYIDAGITINKVASVVEAQKSIDQINNKIISALRGIGVEKGNIKTSNYSITPNYNYENNENKIDGYNANATVEIKVKDPQLASKVIETVTGAGANQINGSRFVVDKPELYREEARNAAIKNAKDQAEKMAKSLGIKLGKITNIVETSPDQSSSPIYAAKVSMDSISSGRGPTIEQGSQTLTSTVTLYFEKQ